MKKLGVFFLALSLIVGFFPQISKAATTISDQDLQAYLDEVSAIRGFEVTREDIESSLLYWDETDSIDNYATVDDLSGYLGDVIKADLSNLDSIYESYDMTQESMLALLEENGDSVDDYVFVEDLDDAVFYYQYPADEQMDDVDPEAMVAALMSELKTGLNELGLNETEIDALKEHLMSLEEKFSNEDTIAELEDLSNRMTAIGEFSSVDELSEDQIAEILDIYNDLLDIYELKVDFALVVNGKETTVTIIDLLGMDDTEMSKVSLKVTIKDLAGNVLGDMLVTGDDVDSDTIVETGKDIEKATEKVTEKPVVKKTVKGGKLPNTASDFGQNSLLGLAILGAGFALFRKVRTR